METRMPTEWSDEIAIAELSDEPTLSEELSELFARINDKAGGSVPHIVLNMNGVSYLNSSHLAQLLRLRKRLNECGRALVICSLSDEVWSMILLTGLDKVFRFADDPMTALAGLQLDERGAS